jgi:hypothetical protein
MGVALIFNVKFAVVKPSPGGQAGNAFQYRKEPRQALVQAVSNHPKDLLTVLNNNIALAAGENIEIIHAAQVSGGTEGVGSVLT